VYRRVEMNVKAQGLARNTLIHAFITTDFGNVVGHEMRKRPLGMAES
jgi:hypothetical protein